MEQQTELPKEPWGLVIHILTSDILGIRIAPDIMGGGIAVGSLEEIKDTFSDFYERGQEEYADTIEGLTKIMNIYIMKMPSDVEDLSKLDLGRFFTVAEGDEEIYRELSKEALQKYEVFDVSADIVSHLHNKYAYNS